MSFLQVKVRSYGYDPGGVQGGVTGVIVVCDMVKVDGGGDIVDLEQLTNITPEVGVVDDARSVALEVTMIDRVEANQGDPQAPVGLRQTGTDQITVRGKLPFENVEGVEERADRFVISRLSLGEACAVNAVVDGVVNARVYRVDGGTKLWRVEIVVAPAGGLGALCKLGVEKAYNV